MYEVRFSGKQKKLFKRLLQKLSTELKNKIRDILENNPYPSPTHGDRLCKVEKKGKLYCIEATGGDRILYDIIELGQNQKFVRVVFSGDDDAEIRFLKKHAK